MSAPSQSPATPPSDQSTPPPPAGTSASAAKQALLARWRSGGAPRRSEIARRTSPGPAPASYTQEALWFLVRLREGNPFYNMALPVRLSGPLDADALRTAVAGLLARHDVLRTGFESVEGRPVQVVAPVAAIAVPLVLHDAGELGVADDPDEIDAWIRTRAHQPFDITRPPLVGFDVLRLGADDHVLTVRMHHLIGDGLSMGILAHELGDLYAAARHGQAPALPALPIQFADFAAWQRGDAQSAVIAA
ncbi:condensation domain-containing protein, partial [Candidatus Frankia nodulisporulans]